MKLSTKKQIITVQEARKLLGHDASNLSDAQVEEIIHTLTLMAKKYLNKNSSKIKVGIYG